MESWTSQTRNFKNLRLGEPMCAAACLPSYSLFFRFVFQAAFEECYWYIKKLLGIESGNPHVKRLMTDPVLFNQVLCLICTCNEVRFDTTFSNEFIRLMLEDHPDFSDNLVVVDGKSVDGEKMVASMEDDGKEEADKDDGDKHDKKSSGARGNRNVIKYACCIPKALRYKLQDAMSQFSQDLFSQLPPDMPQDREHDISVIFSERYSLFFGSVFWLDVMRARACLREQPPRVRDYVRECLKIRIDLGSHGALSLLLRVPWQDVVSSVRASLPSHAQPSLHDWLSMLPQQACSGVSEQAIAHLLSVDVSLYREMWAELDAAYAAPANGFFDFRAGARAVFRNHLQNVPPPSQPMFPSDDNFDNWWQTLDSISKIRSREAKPILRARRKHEISRLDCFVAAPPAPKSPFWEQSAKALWLLDLFLDSREIMFEEYRRTQELDSGGRVGAKRKPHVEGVVRTFAQLFDNMSSTILDYSESQKEVLLLHKGTPKAMICRNFSEWLKSNQEQQPPPPKQ